MNDSILGNDYYEEVRKRALKDVKEAKEKMNITIEKELYEMDLIGKLNAVNDMKDSLTYIEKEEEKKETKTLKNEYKLKYDGYTTINKELNNRIDYSFTDNTLNEMK